MKCNSLSFSVSNDHFMVFNQIEMEVPYRILIIFSEMASGNRLVGYGLINVNLDHPGSRTSNSRAVFIIITRWQG